MDLFDKAETLERIWPRLVTSYAMDALARRKENAGSFTARGAGVLVEHVGQIEYDACPSVGAGKDWRFEAEGIVGQALVAKRVCVHMSVFPNDDNKGRQNSHRPRILPPSRRRWSV